MHTRKAALHVSLTTTVQNSKYSIHRQTRSSSIQLVKESRSSWRKFRRIPLSSSKQARLERYSRRCFQADTTYTLLLRLKGGHKSKRIEGTPCESSGRTCLAI